MVVVVVGYRVVWLDVEFDLFAGEGTDSAFGSLELGGSGWMGVWRDELD